MYKEDILPTLRSGQFLCRQTQTIASWLPLLSHMNTRYVRNGGLLSPARFETWSSLPESGRSLSPVSSRAADVGGALPGQVARPLLSPLHLGERVGPDGLRGDAHPPEAAGSRFPPLRRSASTARRTSFSRSSPPTAASVSSTPSSRRSIACWRRVWRRKIFPRRCAATPRCWRRTRCGALARWRRSSS